MRFPDGFKRFNDDIAVVLELAHPQAECLQRDILQLVDLGNHVIGTPFVSIARGDGIFADVVFENIRPVRFILFPEKTRDDISTRFGEFFLIAQYLQTFQEDLFWSLRWILWLTISFSTMLLATPNSNVFPSH